MNNERIKNGEEMTVKELGEFARRISNAYRVMEDEDFFTDRVVNEEKYMNRVSRAIKGEFDNDPRQMKISNHISKMAQYIIAAENMYIPDRKDGHGREINPIREFCTIPYIRTTLTAMSKSPDVNDFLNKAKYYQDRNDTVAGRLDQVLGQTPAEKDRETAVKYLEKFPEGFDRDYVLTMAEEAQTRTQYFDTKAEAILAKILIMHDDPYSQRNHVEKRDDGYTLSDTPERQNNQNQQLVKSDKKIKCKDVQKDLVIGGVNVTEVKRVLGEFGQNIKGAIRGNSRDDEDRNR